jgi:TPR repeat protein
MLADNQDERLAFAAMAADSFVEAEKLFSPLAEQGSVYALKALAWMHYAEKLPNSELRLAEQYYESAGKLGDTEAYHDLGLLFQESGDVLSAQRVFEIAANSGSLKSMYRLGKILADDDRGSERALEGRYWMERAANQGHFFSKRWLLVDNASKGNLLSKIILPFRLLVFAVQATKFYISDPGSELVKN